MAFEGLPNIPDVPVTGNQDLDEFFRAVKETLDKVTGRQVTTDMNRVLAENEIQARHGKHFGTRLSISGNQSVSATTNTTVAFDQVPNFPLTWGVDDTNNLDIFCPEATGVFTCFEDGIYQLTGSLLVQISSTIDINSYLAFLSRNYDYLTGISSWTQIDAKFHQYTTQAGDYFNIYLHGVVAMLKGDRAKIELYSSAGCTVRTGYSFFTIAKINDYR